MKVKRIQTAGYRGPGTNNQYMPAGWYTVGTELNIQERIIPESLARYLVETGQVIGFDATPPDQKQVPDTSEIAQTQEASEPETAADDEIVTDPHGETWNLTLLHGMDVKELRDLAQSEGIEIPKGRLSKEALIDLIVTQ